MKSKAPSDAASKAAPESKVTFFADWCKRCGNCVAFCPRKALAQDEWGHPYLKDPERCTSCGLCGMLCPDFCISVGEGPAPAGAAAGSGGGSPDAAVSSNQSPERLAPEPREEEQGG